MGLVGAVPVPARAASGGDAECEGRRRTASARGPEVAAFVDPGADGECPLTHPVKAKLASGIYHVPGGGNYERTKPDRCYSTAEAAEADGLRPAKR